MADLKPLTPAGSLPRVMPQDAMQRGVHSSLQRASKHKKMVSGVLHLKRESSGKLFHPIAYGKKGGIAFKTLPTTGLR